MAATIFLLIYYLSIIISILSSAKKSRFIFGTHYSGFGTGTGTEKTREISGLGTRDQDSRAALVDIVPIIGNCSVDQPKNQYR